MIKILYDAWNRNQNSLRQILSEREDLNACSYVDLIKIIFEIIYNRDECVLFYDKLNLDKIHEIDDGDYQGTLIYLIPFDAYQPHEGQYFMTYIDYGSCSGCDTLQAIQSIQDYGNDKLTDQQVTDFMLLSLDILRNTIIPFNYGWRYDPDFSNVDF